LLRRIGRPDADPAVGVVCEDAEAVRTGPDRLHPERTPVAASRPPRRYRV